MLGRYLTWTRMVLLASAIGFTLLVAQDAQPALAAGTKVFITKADTTAVAPIILYPNGALEQVSIRVSDVKEPTGVSAFEVDVEVPTNLASIYFMNSNITWLQSTGRVATCSNPTFTVISPTVTAANVSCNTYLPAPPYGATTSAGQAPPLANIYLQPGATPGNGLLKVTTRTKLVNTPVNPDDLAEIPITRGNGTIIVARCADFSGDNYVTIVDIVRQVAAFGTTNVFYDLNGNGNVSIADITITVYQYGTACPPA